MEKSELLRDGDFEKYKVFKDIRIIGVLGITKSVLPELAVFVYYEDDTVEVVPTRIVALKAPVVSHV
ncbi:unnamed protein product [Gongylonema pulchrum]|uniref:Uncharacterized protein n=1 Tax=Gongylonema pulchrum TaxID=637853 RepID=A0A3P6QJU1_9BILA|nr:unnamed protein product [Gongylonema pulchrum]